MKDQTTISENEQILRQRLAQREAELLIINSVQKGLAEKLNVQAIYDLVGDQIRDIFNAQVVMISPYDHQTDTIDHRYAIERGQRVYSPGPHLPGGFRSKIIRTGQPILVNTNVSEEAARLGQPTLPGTMTPKSWLGVPMIVRGQITGILSLQNVDQENAFSESDVRLLQTLAGSLSVALENARLWEQEMLFRKGLEREFEIGREIQAGFLPERLPQPEGWEIAASLRSAREVAGDFYDVFELSDGTIGTVIADVCDKGLGAALFMTLFRSLLRAISNIDFFTRADSEHMDTPAVRLKNAISLTNNYIVETHGDTGMFATIFFGILDVKSGLLTYINGGHLPPLLIDKSGVKESLQTSGPAVGAVNDTDYLVQQVMFAEGDTLFAYTDGLTDTVSPSGELLNVNEFVPSLGAGQPLHILLDQFQERIVALAAGSKQFDDITMLAVRRNNYHPHSL